MVKAGFLMSTAFSHRQVTSKVLIMQAGHEPLPHNVDNIMSGYGQALSALNYGLGPNGLGHQSFMVVPYSNPSYRCGENGEKPDDVVSFEINAGQNPIKIAALEKTAPDGTPYIALMNTAEPGYFAFTPYQKQPANHLLQGSTGGYASGLLEEKALVFNLALAELARRIRVNLEGHEKLIFHGHDHMTALATCLAAKDGIPTAFTVHNPAYSTSAPLELLKELGLEVKGEHKQVDLLALAFTQARRLTTVSPSYAYEIKSTNFDFGPEGQKYGPILYERERHNEFRGILNALPPSFLPPPNSPVRERGNDEPVQIFLANRLTGQKNYGPLIHGLGLALAYPLKETKVRFSILADGEQEISDELTALAQAHPQQLQYNSFSREGFFCGLREADLALIPSRFEPFGQFAATAQAHGVLTLGAMVGGLKDILGRSCSSRWASPLVPLQTAVSQDGTLQLGHFGLFFPETFPKPLSSEQFWAGLIRAIGLIKNKTPGFGLVRENARKMALEIYQPQRMAKDYFERVYSPLLNSGR